MKTILKNKMKVTGYLWLIAGILFHLWYEVIPGKWMVDSDMASEMIYADLLNKEHAVISNSWFFSSEIRVFQTNWLYRIGLLLSPNNWHLARIIASVLLLAILLGSFLYFAKALKLDTYAVWGAAILSWPLGRWYFIYVLFGHWYITYIAIIFTVLGILFRLKEAKGRARTILLGGSGILLSFLGGLNGVKQTFCFFAPLILAILILLILEFERNKAQTLREFWGSDGGTIKIAIWSVILFLSDLAGYLVNSKVLSRIYSFTDWNEAVLQIDNPNRLYDVLKDFFFLPANVSDVELFTLSGMGAVAGIGIGLILLLCLIRLATMYSVLEIEEKICVLLVPSALIVCGLFFCLVGDYKQYYWLPVFPIALTLVLVAIKHDPCRIQTVKSVYLIGFAVLITFVGTVTVKDELNAPLISVTREKNDYVDLTNFLLENGYTQGYASFWSGNVLTEMSDGRIEVWTLCNVQDNLVIYEFLQKRSHVTTVPQGKCFLVFNELYDGPAEQSIFINYAKGEKIYDKNTFSVWTFDSAVDLYNAFATVLNGGTAP